MKKSIMFGSRKWARRLYGFVAIAVILIIGMRLHRYHQYRYAQFTVDVLQRMITSYALVEERQINSLAELPDFHVVAPGDSLTLQAKDLRDGGILRGYVYDLTREEDGKYVISASPVGFLSPEIELGSTEDGLLHMNLENIDPLPDSYDEVQGWPYARSKERARTKDLPDYLQD